MPATAVKASTWTRLVAFFWRRVVFVLLVGARITFFRARWTVAAVVAVSMLFLLGRSGPVLRWNNPVRGWLFHDLRNASFADSTLDAPPHLFHCRLSWDELPLNELVTDFFHVHALGAVHFPQNGHDVGDGWLTWLRRHVGLEANVAEVRAVAIGWFLFHVERLDGFVLDLALFVILHAIFGGWWFSRHLFSPFCFLDERET